MRKHTKNLPKFLVFFAVFTLILQAHYIQAWYQPNNGSLAFRKEENNMDMDHDPDEEDNEENEELEEGQEPKEPERPLECTECKKPIAVHYTEIIGSKFTSTGMCADCPHLLRRLQGLKAGEEETSLEGGTGVVCGTCGTTLQAVRMGATLGCSECYNVFEKILFSELLSAGKVSPQLLANQKSQVLHIGRSPGERQEMNLATRLLALNEALNETLRREDYEQAALLRDQIKELTEKTDKENHDERTL